MDREKAIREFPEAVKAGDDVAADNAVARAAIADETLRNFGYTPPQ